MYSVLDSISCSLYSIRFLYLVSIAYIAITGLSPYVPPFKYKTRSLNRCHRVASMFWERFSGTLFKLIFILHSVRHANGISDSIAEKNGSPLIPWPPF